MTNQRKAELREYCRKNPKAKVSEVAWAFGCGESTARRYLADAKRRLNK